MKNDSSLITLFFLTFLLLGLLPGCQEAPTKDNATIDEPQEQVAIENQQVTISYTSVDSILVVAEVDRKTLPYNGRFVSAQSWNDKLGQNTLILSEKGEREEGEGRKELFAYHYVQAGTSQDLLWQMNDFVDGEGCDLDIQLINAFPLVSDVNSNGIAETAIFYSLDARCDASTFPAKLIIHEGEDKVAIRGVRAQYLWPPEHVWNQYRAEQDLPPIKYKNLDAGSSSMDAAIVAHYSAQWDSFIKLENESNGALPDDMITRIK
jgi:hypothetical protein